METGLANKPVQFVDATYDASRAESCHLVLRISPDSASYAVIETERNVVLATGVFPVLSDETPVSLLQRMCGEELFGARFQSVSLSVDRVPFALVPQILQPSADQLPSFGFGVEVSDTSSQSIEALKAAIHYQVPEGLESAFHGRFPQGQLHHAGGLWVMSLMRKNRFARGAQLYLNVEPSGMSAFLMVNSDLRLYNTFVTEGAYDVLYHALNVCQQHGMAASDVQVRISGEVQSNDDLLEVLKSQFTKVDINFGLDFQRMALGLSRVKKHQFAMVFNQHVCVS